ncbi:hypothetical protein Anapl_02958 [Anas platyrhynchos]|uniref:Uncharacterized protein n=1 Tax=Anas platyrhynchos TaxID=8839 RepID=R0LEV4_ANAPL|nr:hypothetical protein Anapl_02958 [Anas platyrhynchos]
MGEERDPQTDTTFEEHAEHQQRQHRVARNTWLSGQERTGMHFQGAAANKVCLRVLTRPQPKELENWIPYNPGDRTREKLSLELQTALTEPGSSNSRLVFLKCHSIIIVSKHQQHNRNLQYSTELPQLAAGSGHQLVTVDLEWSVLGMTPITMEETAVREASELAAVKINLPVLDLMQMPYLCPPNLAYIPKPQSQLQD